MAPKHGATAYAKNITNDLCNESTQKRSFYDHNYYCFFIFLNSMRSVNDVLAGNSDRYPIERSNKRHFQSLYVQISPRKQLLCSFLPENCSKHALVGSRWVSGADQQYIMSIFF